MPSQQHYCRPLNKLGKYDGRFEQLRLAFHGLTRPEDAAHKFSQGYYRNWLKDLRTWNVKFGVWLEDPRAWEWEIKFPTSFYPVEYNHESCWDHWESSSMNSCSTSMKPKENGETSISSLERNDIGSRVNDSLPLLPPDRDSTDVVRVSRRSRRHRVKNTIKAPCLFSLDGQVSPVDGTVTEVAEAHDGDAARQGDDALQNEDDCSLAVEVKIVKYNRAKPSEKSQGKLVVVFMEDGDAASTPSPGAGTQVTAQNHASALSAAAAHEAQQVANPGRQPSLVPHSKPVVRFFNSGPFYEMESKGLLISMSGRVVLTDKYNGDIEELIPHNNTPAKIAPAHASSPTDTSLIMKRPWVPAKVDENELAMPPLEEGRGEYRKDNGRAEAATDQRAGAKKDENDGRE